MAELLYISRANPLHFRIETAAGTYVDDNQDFDAVPDMNLLAEDIAANLPCITQGAKTCQPFQCDDSTTFQFRYDRPGKDPYLFWHEEGSQVWGRYRRPGQMDQPGASLWRANIDFPDFPCHSCIQFRLVSIGTSYAAYSGNYFTDGEDGTFENPGGVTGIFSGGDLGNLNTVTQDASFFRTGTKSCKVKAAAAPNTQNRCLMTGQTQISLNAQSVYFAEAYIWVDGASQIVTSSTIGADIKININRNTGGLAPVNYPNGWTDCAVIEKMTWADHGFPVDQWVHIYAKFMVNTDTDGFLVIDADINPNANKSMYIDDVRIAKVSAAVEATTEVICLDTEYKCSVGVTYTAIQDEEHEQFGLEYNGVLGIEPTFFIRVPNLMWMQFQMTDEKYDAKAESSDNEGKVIRSNITKVNRFTTGLLPWWMLEKLPMIMKHDKVTIELYPGSSGANNKDYICLTGNFTPKYELENRGIFGTLEWEMRPRLYNYQNDNCGQS